MWSCPPSKRVIHQQLLDQGPGCPKTFLGSYSPRYKTKDQPCPRHGYPGTCPGALDISRDFNYLVPDQEPQLSTRGPYKGLLLLGPRPRILVIYWGPLQGFLLLGPRPRTLVIYWRPLQVSFAIALTVWSQTKNPRSALGS